ncbi:MAG: hypothetical protein ACPG4U_12280, partial [Pseudomonadales bacterium]
MREQIQILLSAEPKTRAFAQLDWQPFACGTSNRLFRADTQSQRLVLRLNASAELAFGVDRWREAQVLQSLQGFAWAPKVLLNAVAAQWCLMDYAGERGVLDTPLKTQMLGVVGRVQQLDVKDFPRFDYAALAKDYTQVLSDSPHPVAMQLCRAVFLAIE